MRAVVIAMMMVFFCGVPAIAQEQPVIYTIKYDSTPGESAESIMIRADKKEKLKSFKFYGINTSALVEKVDSSKEHYKNPTAVNAANEREQYEKAF